jgi:hypothetical protein
MHETQQTLYQINFRSYTMSFSRVFRFPTSLTPVARPFHSSSSVAKKFKPQKPFLLPGETLSQQRDARKTAERIRKGSERAAARGLEVSRSSRLGAGTAIKKRFKDGRGIKDDDEQDHTPYGLRTRPSSQKIRSNYDSSPQYEAQSSTAHQVRRDIPISRPSASPSTPFGLTHRMPSPSASTRPKSPKPIIPTKAPNPEAYSNFHLPASSWSSNSPVAADGLLPSARFSVKNRLKEALKPEELDDGWDLEDDMSANNRKPTTSSMPAVRGAFSSTRPRRERKDGGLDWKRPSDEEYARYGRKRFDRDASRERPRGRTDRQDGRPNSVQRERPTKAGGFGLKRTADRSEGRNAPFNETGERRINDFDRTEPTRRFNYPSQLNNPSDPYGSRSNSVSASAAASPTTSSSTSPPKPTDLWSPTKRLSRPAMALIQQLHKEDPVTFDRFYLSQQFKISVEAVTRILRSQGKWMKGDDKGESSS